ncbi:MAG: hypothetical protein M3454_00255 [Actinomycetota bacterium]|nr:hypothetical protein [Actinomycetota bacterium]
MSLGSAWHSSAPRLKGFHTNNDGRLALEELAAPQDVIGIRVAGVGASVAVEQIAICSVPPPPEGPGPSPEEPIYSGA